MDPTIFIGRRIAVCRTDLIMRAWLSCGILALALSFANATTLRQLSLDDMIQKSTAIVRGRVQLNGAKIEGGYIYTHYTVQVAEQWKGASVSHIDLAVPGGTANGLEQTIAGAPVFTDGQEYVLYLWTSRSGITQVIGLSQGLFVSANGMVARPGITEHMIDAKGAEASDQGMQMTLAAMRARVAGLLKMVRSK
jgi:hypothetical protein